MKSKQTKSAYNNVIDVCTSASLVTNKVMPRLGLERRSVHWHGWVVHRMPTSFLTLNLVCLNCLVARHWCCVLWHRKTHDISYDFIVLFKDLAPMEFSPLQRLPCLTAWNPPSYAPFSINMLMKCTKIRKKECNVLLQSRGEVRPLDRQSVNCALKNKGSKITCTYGNIVHTKLDQK